MSLITTNTGPLNFSRDDESNTSLGTLFQCSITLVKKFLLISDLNLPEVIFSQPITYYLGEETSPHLATVSFQILADTTSHGIFPKESLAVCLSSSIRGTKPTLISCSPCPCFSTATNRLN